VPQRGILPDAENGESVFLIKACRYLRLTHEVRLATFMAMQSGRRLEIVMAADYALAPALADFAKQYGIVIRRHPEGVSTLASSTGTVT